jgi:cysteinyl-tRNA synthetase
MLKIYNTMTGRKEEFLPLKSGKVGMYVCGVTVYDECHLGHARTYVAFDVIRRYLEYKGLEVNHIQNFTDVDDKIINKAREMRKKEKKDDLSILIKGIVARYTGEYFVLMDKLNIKRACLYPKATENIAEMIEIIKSLLEKGYGYEVSGNVYFSIKSFSKYGKLSGRNLSELYPGRRVEIDEQKRDPLDFALWKKGKEDEPLWDSPWGKGRPGWHIECSAMSMKYLGESFDIHAGGGDLIFPHHENEIAQSEAHSNKSLARYWLHTGFVTLGEEKMSKSLGNTFLLREVLDKYPPVAVRFFLLSTHYRKPIEVSEEQFESAKRGAERIAICLSNVKKRVQGFKGSRVQGHQSPQPKADPPLAEVTNHQIAIESAMDDDFNAPAAIGIIFELVSKVNILLENGELSQAAALARDIKSFCDILGLNFKADEELDEELFSLIRDRDYFRLRKDWKKADAIRQTLLAKGIALEDTPNGTNWRRL